MLIGISMQILGLIIILWAINDSLNRIAKAIENSK